MNLRFYIAPVNTSGWRVLVQAEWSSSGVTMKALSGLRTECRAEAGTTPVSSPHLHRRTLGRHVTILSILYHFIWLFLGKGPLYYLHRQYNVSGECYQQVSPCVPWCSVASSRAGAVLPGNQHQQTTTTTTSRRTLALSSRASNESFSRKYDYPWWAVI